MEDDAHTTERIIGAAIAVHRELGPGLLESAYQRCLAIELTDRGIPFERELRLALRYSGTLVPDAFRVDFRVEGRVVVEVKAMERTRPVHEAQLLTYMKLADAPLGLLLNFNRPRLVDGITRMRL